MKQVMISACSLFLLVMGLLAVMPSPAVAQYRGGGQYYAKQDTVAYRYDRSRRQKKIAAGSLIYVGSINGDWGMIRDNGNKMWTIQMAHFETAAAHKRRLAAAKAAAAAPPSPPKPAVKAAPKVAEPAKPAKPVKPAKPANVTPELEELQRLEDAAKARAAAQKQLEEEEKKLLEK